MLTTSPNSPGRATAPVGVFTTAALAEKNGRVMTGYCPLSNARRAHSRPREK